MQKHDLGPEFTARTRCYLESDVSTAEGEAALPPIMGMTPAKIKMAKAGPLAVKDLLRELIAKAGSSRKVKRFKRTAIIQILKGDFRPSHFQVWHRHS